MTTRVSICSNFDIAYDLLSRRLGTCHTGSVNWKIRTKIGKSQFERSYLTYVARILVEYSYFPEYNA